MFLFLFRLSFLCDLLTLVLLHTMKIVILCALTCSQILSGCEKKHTWYYCSYRQRHGVLRASERTGDTRWGIALRSCRSPTHPSEGLKSETRYLAVAKTSVLSSSWSSVENGGSSWRLPTPRGPLRSVGRIRSGFARSPRRVRHGRSQRKEGII